MIFISEWDEEEFLRGPIRDTAIVFYVENCRFWYRLSCRAIEPGTASSLLKAVTVLNFPNQFLIAVKACLRDSQTLVIIRVLPDQVTQVRS